MEDYLGWMSEYQKELYLCLSSADTSGNQAGLMERGWRKGSESSVYEAQPRSLCLVIMGP
jgi:hypothetical protein